MHGKRLIKHCTLLFGLLLGVAGYGQPLIAPKTDWPVPEGFAERQAQLNRRGMVMLGGWGAGSVASGLALWLQDGNSEEVQSFGQMSAAWGGIDLLLAVPGYLGSIRSKSTVEAVRFEQRKLEGLYLLNAGLDVFYVGGGYWLHRANMGRADADGARNRGWGQAVMVQGGFLLAFDGLMYWVHRRHRLRPRANVTAGLGQLGGVPTFRLRVGF